MAYAINPHTAQCNQDPAGMQFSGILSFGAGNKGSVILVVGSCCIEQCSHLCCLAKVGKGVRVVNRFLGIALRLYLKFLNCKLLMVSYVCSYLFRLDGKNILQILYFKY